MLRNDKDFQKHDEQSGETTSDDLTFDSLVDNRIVHDDDDGFVVTTKDRSEPAAPPNNQSLQRIRRRVLVEIENSVMDNFRQVRNFSSFCPILFILLTFDTYFFCSYRLLLVKQVRNFSSFCPILFILFTDL